MFDIVEWETDVNKPGAKETNAKFKKKYGYDLTGESVDAYASMYVIADALERAGATDPAKVREALAGQTFAAPSGYTLTMDKTNHHLHKPVMIGEVQEDGQFSIVWQTEGPLRAQPWSPFIPGNDKKPDYAVKSN